MQHKIWTEKYRPQTFDEIRGQEHVIGRVQKFVEKKNMPHLMFAGPAGVGKTTLALVIAKQLFGPNWRANVLELNASDERGIDVIRNNVKDFARTKALGNVPFKIIYLDECDALTKEAQQALRRTMENYTHTTRFVLSCNYSSKIIDPIQSRCAVFRFKPLPEEALKKIIATIVANESLTIDDAGIAAAIEVSRGDVRRLENVLQAAASNASTVTEELIYDIASFAKPGEVGEMLALATKGDFLGARKLMSKIMLEYGLSGLDVCRQMQQAVWKLDLKDRQKLTLIKACGETEFRLVEGADEMIQLEAFLATCSLVLE